MPPVTEKATDLKVGLRPALPQGPANKTEEISRGFGVLQGWGFEICRTCPHGRDCAEETPHPRFQKGKGENNHTAVQGPVCVGGTR